MRAGAPSIFEEIDTQHADLPRLSSSASLLDPSTVHNVARESIHNN